jgi:hypothetical protein
MAEQGTQQAQQPAASMSEAGFSMNVRIFDKHGQEVMLTFRCPLVNQAEKLITVYENMMEQLLGIGWRPINNGAKQTADAPANGGAVPVCRVHGRQMKPSRKPGSFYCSSKLADGSYCVEKVDG